VLGSAMLGDTDSFSKPAHLTSWYGFHLLTYLLSYVAAAPGDQHDTALALSPSSASAASAATTYLAIIHMFEISPTLC
jgi:hypothetical protein